MEEFLDSDTFVGLKRRTILTEDCHGALPGQSIYQSSVGHEDEESSGIVSTLGEEGEIIEKNPTFESSSVAFHKKAMYSSGRGESESNTDEEKQMDSAEETIKSCASLNDKISICDSTCGSSVLKGKDADFSKKVHSFGDGVQETEQYEVDFISGVEPKQETFDSLNSETETTVNLVEHIPGFSAIQESGVLNEGTYGKCEAEEKSLVEVQTENKESENLLEIKRKRLLEELEVILLPEDERGVANIADKKKSGCDEVHARALGFEVVDETAIIDCLHDSGIGKGYRKEADIVSSAKCTGRDGMKEADVKKEKRSRRKANREKKALERCAGYETVTGDEAQNNGCQKNGETTKKMYSRKEMLSLRFVSIVEQRHKWKEIHNGLATTVAKEYDELGCCKQQKHMGLNFDPRQCFLKKEEAPGFFGAECSETINIELGQMENAETVGHLDPSYNHSITGKDGWTDLVEGDCNKDDDSDEEYASIQKPAFSVEGEPNFESGPPEDGLEYLRRVRWEAAQIPKVKVAKVDRSKIKKEQSAYMPEIPDIVECPEHLLPLKQWEDAFLADFSDLRVLPGATLENYNNVMTEVVNSDNMLLNFSSLHKSIGDLSSVATKENNAELILENSISASCKNESSSYPFLSTILAMDSVARVSMLRKRISSVKNMSSLSRNDGMWLFALCAAVDTPLDADACASLRSLLRKCASLRGRKAELDDEAVMLTILATISGRYFGQSKGS
ncbi:gem-associated protein 2-like [Quillaja saponaria]|uniref:Gem-associated protein 2-like n=1 Tax=Quillaja saponaria TaxID=32244 RepID=A0AAD7LG61_QUISA|nr:gem-associated protein 2-like [Quillaja saponaria]